MSKIQRIGDANVAGGVITSVVQPYTYINGILVSVDGSPVSPHKPFSVPHIAPTTANGSANLFIQGIPVNREGDADTCGHARADGSPDTFNFNL